MLPACLPIICPKDVRAANANVTEERLQSHGLRALPEGCEPASEPSGIRYPENADNVTHEQLSASGTGRIGGVRHGEIIPELEKLFCQPIKIGSTFLVEPFDSSVVMDDNNDRLLTGRGYLVLRTYHGTSQHSLVIGV